MNDTIFTFLLILATSFVFSTLLTRFPLLRIPSTVSYLIFGMLLHTGITHLSPEEIRWLNHLADFGLLFLMYLSGLEVDVTRLNPKSWKSSKQNTAYIGLAIFASTLLLSFALSLALYRHFPQPSNPYMFALLFSTNSLGIILPILEEAGIIQTNYGQTILVSALIADFLTMLLLSMFISSQTAGNLLEVLMTLAIIPFTISVYGILRILQRISFFRRLAGDVQTRIRAIIALLAITCALAEFSGAEPILGSFLVGMLVSALPFSFKQKLHDYSHGIGYGFLVPLFFISVGLDFDFRAFDSLHTLIWIPILIIIAFTVKVIPALHLKSAFGWRMAFAGGCLLSARLSLIAAAAQIGVSIHMLPVIFAEAIILAAVATSLLGPILFLTIAPKQWGTNKTL
jgi:Kef-type K+ transport system membrane component KefB